MKFIIASIIMSCWVGVLFCSEYIVIVNNDNSMTSVSKADLKRVYTGKMDNIKGNNVNPVNISLNDPAAASFLDEIVGMGVADYKSFWLAEQIRGGSSAPSVTKSAEDMLSHIKSNTNAIGYIPKNSNPDGVKVLTVN
ncbi:MAG TPA: hypothetical protein VFD91_16715 [Mariniphaga sp.]|nr:hypothetical protein [Mariniphaga sp.]